MPADVIQSPEDHRGFQGISSVDTPPWLSRSLFPFEIKAARFDERAELTYVDEGRGPLLLFTPGSPMWSFMFRATIATLQGHFRCISLDLPGLGLSKVPLARGRAFAGNADWLQRFVRALDLPRFTLITHATAGPSALEMAIRERARVQGVVVTNSFAWSFADVPKFRMFSRVLSSPPLAFANVYLGFLPWVASRYGRRARPFTPDERAAVVGPFLQREPRKHLQNLLLGLRLEDEFFRHVNRRAEVLRDVPALLLYGGRDNGYRLGFVDRWKRLFPRHDVVVLEQGDHFAPEDQPEDYTAALAAWWHRTVAQSNSLETG